MQQSEEDLQKESNKNSPSVLHPIEEEKNAAPNSVINVIPPQIEAGPLPEEGKTEAEPPLISELINVPSTSHQHQASLSEESKDSEPTGQAEVPEQESDLILMEEHKDSDIAPQPSHETPVKQPESQSSQYDESAATIHCSPEGKVIEDPVVRKSSDDLEQTGISSGKIEDTPVKPPEETPPAEDEKNVEEDAKDGPMSTPNQQEVEDNSPEKQSERGGDNARHIEAGRSAEDEKKEAGFADNNYERIAHPYMAAQYGYESTHANGAHIILARLQQNIEEYKKRVLDLETGNRECI